MRGRTSAIHTVSRTMIDVGLLVVGREHQRLLDDRLATVAAKVRRRLYVRVGDQLDLFQVLVQVYGAASRVCRSLDVRVLIDERPGRHYDAIFAENDAVLARESERKRYRAVVLGGTFDRLHNGHKVLLSRAALAASQRVVCGVTHKQMIEKKILWELMQPLEVRQNAVKEFVEDVSDRVRCETHPIDDPYGPSIVDSDLQAIVVSEETVNGGRAVNDRRKERNLSHLDLIKIDLIDGQDAVLNEHKLSSSAGRRALLGTSLKAFKLKILPHPLVIGLTGGIASGKSKAAAFLAEHNCQVINCDQLAHQLYDDDKSLVNEIGKHFGEAVVSGGIVNRIALGRIVFADKEKLALLNRIVWPSLRRKVETLIAHSDHDIVVVDAAILFEANWDRDGLVHQVWCCMVPVQTAIERVVERDHISAEQAQRRVDSQLNNVQRLERTNVVICSLWTYAETRRQLLLALNSLRSLITRQCGTPNSSHVPLVAPESQR